MSAEREYPQKKKGKELSISVKHGLELREKSKYEYIITIVA